MRFLCACLCARHDSEQSIAIDRWRHQTCAVNMLHQTTAAAQHTNNNHIMPGTMHARTLSKMAIVQSDAHKCAVSGATPPRCQTEAF